MCVYSANTWVVRKVATDGNLAWMVAIASFVPIQSSLTVDANEQHVYFAKLADPLDVVGVSATLGTIQDVNRL